MSVLVTTLCMLITVDVVCSKVMVIDRLPRGDTQYSSLIFLPTNKRMIAFLSFLIALELIMNF